MFQVQGTAVGGLRQEQLMSTRRAGTLLCSQLNPQHPAQRLAHGRRSVNALWMAEHFLYPRHSSKCTVHLFPLVPNSWPMSWLHV